MIDWAYRTAMATVLALLLVTMWASVAGAQNIRCSQPGAKVVGTPRVDVMVAHPGGCRLFGMAGDDKMIGQRGADQLFGGPGDDLVHGGHGNDVLSGGPGADIFRLFDNDGRNEIIDFEGGDRILIKNPAPMLYGYYSDNGCVLRNGRTTVDVQQRGGGCPPLVQGSAHGHDFLSLPVFTTGKGYREQFMTRPLTADEKFGQGQCAPRVVTVADIGQDVIPGDDGACHDGFDFGPLTTGAIRILIEPVVNGARGVDNATHGCPDCWMLYQSKVWRVTKTAAGVVTKIDDAAVLLVGYDFMHSIPHLHTLRVHTEALFDLAAARRVLARDKQDAQKLADWLASCGSNC